MLKMVPIQPTDEEVIKKIVAEQNLDGFAILYQRYYRRVYCLCLRMLGRPEDAEDLAQDVFFQLFRKLDSFRHEAAFTTWLHRLTVNQVLMHFRKRSTKNEAVTGDGDLPEETTAAGNGDPAMPIIDHITLSEAIAELSPGYLQVFELHDVQGYEHKEVAKILGCSIGNSKSQLHKARMKLRRILSSRSGDIPFRCRDIEQVFRVSPAAFWQTIAKFPNEQKTLLYWYYQDQLSIEEIARRLGVVEYTVRARLTILIELISRSLNHHAVHQTADPS